MNFVDEQDRIGHAFELVHDLLQPLLEIAAIARPGKQRAHVERIDHRVLQHFGHFAFDDLARKTFGDRSFPDAGITDIQRVILAPAAQDLDRPVDLRPAADQRIDPAIFGLLVEIDGELVERGFLLALLGCLVLALRLAFFGALRRTAFDLLAALADAVADEAHRVEPAHVLLLEEIDRIAVAFGKQRDQHIGAGHRILAARLDMQDCALDHPLEPRGRLRVGGLVRLQRLVFLFEILLHHRGQFTEVDPAGGHDLRAILVVDQCEQQVFERRIFVPALARIGECGVEGLFEIGGKAGHQMSFSWDSHRANTGQPMGRRLANAVCSPDMGAQGNIFSPRITNYSFRPNNASAALRCAAAELRCFSTRSISASSSAIRAASSSCE